MAVAAIIISLVFFSKLVHFMEVNIALISLIDLSVRETFIWKVNNMHVKYVFK